MATPSDANAEQTRDSLDVDEPRARLFDADMIFTLIIGAIMIAAVISSFRWQVEAALMPRVIATAAVLLIFTRIITRVILVVRGAPAPPPEEIMDLPTDDEGSPEEYLRGAMRVGAWIFGLIVASLLAGVQYTAPVFLFVYLTFQAKMAWWKSMIFVVASVLIIHIGFEDLLGIRLPEGLLFQEGNRR